MLCRNVVFATNVSTSSGAGHFRRLIEISKALPASFKKYFFGSVEISWAGEMVKDWFIELESLVAHETFDLVILDSYDEEFCQQVKSNFSNCNIIQLADRYTSVLPDANLIFMDLPFSYGNSAMPSKVMAHGIEYLPMRSFGEANTALSGQAKRVLVTTGGLVNESIFTQLIEEFSKDKYKEIRFEFIGIYACSESDKPNLRFHDFGSGFDSIAADCDTAISASGTTLWDLLANQKMVGLAATVENQTANFDYAIHSGQAIEVFSPNTLELKVDSLYALLFDSNIRKGLYREISGRYDFYGARRVSEVILKDFSARAS